MVAMILPWFSIRPTAAILYRNNPSQSNTKRTGRSITMAASHNCGRTIRSLFVLLLLLLLSQKQSPTAFPTSAGGYGRRRTCPPPPPSTATTTATTPPRLAMVAPLRTTATGSSSNNSSNNNNNRNNEHELRIGKALDTLRADYQTLLTANPDFTLYDENIEVVDPSGVKLHGLRNYKAAFNFIHALLRVVYCPAQSELSYRMCYDQARSNIRISWNAKIVPRGMIPFVSAGIMAQYGSAHHVDGISVYQMNLETGQITQHRIERLLLNNRPVAPEEGVMERLRAEHGVVVPSFFHGSSSPTTTGGGGGSTSSSTSLSLLQGEGGMSSNSHVSGRSSNSNGRGGGSGGRSSAAPTSIVLSATRRRSNSSRPSRTTALYALEASDCEPDGDYTGGSGGGSSSSSNSSIDRDALERRNRSRQKFGLKPLSPDEFRQLQQEIDVLSDETTRKIARAAEERRQQKLQQEQQQQQELLQQQRRGLGLFEKALGALTADTCETNFDCERPQVCCDFIVQKRCCSSGTFVGREMPRLVPVPADNPSYLDPRRQRQRGGPLPPSSRY